MVVEVLNDTEELEETENCTFGVEVQSDVEFNAFLSIQVIVGAVGWIGNALLLYGQAKTNTWPFYQRLLFFNVTIASMITSIIHCTQGFVQLVKYSLTGLGELGDSEWSDVGGDSAHVAVAFGLMTLAFQNLYALYRCTRKPKIEEPMSSCNKKRTIFGGLTLAAVWLTAVGSIVIGLNPHAEVGEDGDTDMAYISYAVHLAIQASVAVAILITRRVTRRLETDFAARGAQHTLRTRMHVKETINLTAAITRVLILHIVTWVASFTVALVINHGAMTSHPIDPCGSEESAEEAEIAEANQMAAYVGIVDSLALCFEAVYPIVLSMKQPQIQRRIRNLFCCFRHVQPRSFESTPKSASVGAEPAPTPKRGSAKVSHGARVHHHAIDKHWEMITKVKYEKQGAQVAWISE